MAEGIQMEQIFVNLKRNYIKKQGMLLDILKIAQAQRSLIMSDDTESLVKGMDRRDKLIGKIECLDSESEPLLRLIKSKESEKVQVYYEIEQLQKGILEILKGIEKQDRENSASASKKLEEYKREVRLIRLSKKRASFYSKPFESDDGIYIDAKK